MNELKLNLLATAEQRMICNPILPGFYPDPSICRVGDDFYMACSSFELCPGIPIFHSKDLAHWQQLGYAITPENGFHVEANAFAGGVMAPTIRHHDGTFYIICANMADGGNFIVTAQNPAGPWSQIQHLTDVPDIDASLFFDTDGTVYIIGTGAVIPLHDGTLGRGIWLNEFDLTRMRCVGERSLLWDSAMRNAASPEAPHIYKKGDYYYLVIAEGGTEHYHAVTVARSKTLHGWYEGNPANPVLTHRQLGFTYPIDNVGHADLVNTPDGNWYAVVLASRLIDGRHKNLGRETFLCPVIWEENWPVFSPGTGKLEWKYPADPCLPWTECSFEPKRDEFDAQALALPWNTWGTPYGTVYELSDSHLVLHCVPRPLSQPLAPMVFGAPHRFDPCAVVLRRQRHINCTAQCHMRFSPKGDETAGLVVMQACNHQLRLERAVLRGEQVLRLVLVTCSFSVPPYFRGFQSDTQEKTLAQVPWSEETLVLSVEARRQNMAFYYGKDTESLLLLKDEVDARRINTEQIGGMAGTMFGMFASGNGTQCTNAAAFDWFVYAG